MTQKTMYAKYVISQMYAKYVRKMTPQIRQVTKVKFFCYYVKIF